MRHPHPSLESRARMRLTDLQELRHERLVGSAGSDRAESCLVGGMRRLRSLEPNEWVARCGAVRRYLSNPRLWIEDETTNRVVAGDKAARGRP